MRKDNQEMPLPGPYVDPGITDPAALAYKRRLDERRYKTPVGGGPTPPIPRLDADAASGLTMSDQAMAARHRAEVATAPPDSMFQEPTSHPSYSKAPPSILPQDLLPEAATKDPEFREGAGSRYASSQPHLAYKYGVIRNGQHLMSQQLQTGKPGLSEKTVEGLRAIQDLNEKRAQAESPDARIEADAAAGPAGSAARFGNSPGEDGKRPLSEDEREKVSKAVDKLDDFDFNTFREMMMKDLINNEDQRKLVEARIEPLDVTDLIVRGFVTQIVPIIPGKYEPEFQSMAGDDDLALKRLVMNEARGIDVNSRYLLDKYSLMSVALGLRSLNKVALPDYRDKEGNFDDDMFWKKFNKVVRFPFHMLSSLGVHYFWFDVRVRKLFVAEKLGNG